MLFVHHKRSPHLNLAVGTKGQPHKQNLQCPKPEPCSPATCWWRLWALWPLCPFQLPARHEHGYGPGRGHFQICASWCMTGSHFGKGEKPQVQALRTQKVWNCERPFRLGVFVAVLLRVVILALVHLPIQVCSESNFALLYPLLISPKPPRP